MKRRITRAVLVAGILPGLAMLGFSVVASADIPANVDVYGSSASAAGVHVVGVTSQFESFGEGAVNNRYPLAAVGQESAPASHAVASPEDYGPIVGVVFASDPPQPFCPNPVPPPAPACVPISHQAPPETYANAQYPNPPGNAEQTYSTGASDHADARAAELTADAFGSYGGNGASAFNNATAEAHTIVNPDGSIHSYTHSHVSSANFGAFVIRNVDVVTNAYSANSKGRATSTVNPGVIDTGNGAPQVITPGPQGTQFIIPGAPAVPIPAPVPGGPTAVPELAPITVHVYTVSPVNATKDERASICATGTHVDVDQPTTATGGYSRHLSYILGDGCSEAFVLNLADTTVSPPAVTIDSSGDLVTSGGGDITSSTTSVVDPGTASGFTGAVPSSITSDGRSAASGARPRRLALVSSRVPLPLAYLFFLWEALVMGAAASLVWARRVPRVTS